jgi:hypothetical protein
MPEQKVTHCKLPILSGEVGEKASIVQLSQGEFNELRSVYLNPLIPPGLSEAAFGLLVDGQLVGAWALANASNRMMAENAPWTIPSVYLQADFAVTSTVPKLSALVLRAALSKESKLLAERFEHRRVRWAKTTAFTDKPVSMKYRGLFKLVSRKEDPPGHFALNYAAEMGEWTLQEALDAWRKTSSPQG